MVAIKDETRPHHILHSIAENEEELAVPLELVLFPFLLLILLFVVIVPVLTLIFHLLFFLFGLLR